MRLIVFLIAGIAAGLIATAGNAQKDTATEATSQPAASQPAAPKSTRPGTGYEIAPAQPPTKGPSRGPSVAPTGGVQTTPPGSKQPANQPAKQPNRGEMLRMLYDQGRAALEEGDLPLAERRHRQMHQILATNPLTMVLGNKIRDAKSAGPDAILGRTNLLKKIEEARAAEKNGDPRKAQIIFLQVERSPQWLLVPPDVREEVSASRKRLNRQLGTISHGGPQPDSALSQAPAARKKEKPIATLSAENSTMARQLAAKAQALSIEQRYVLKTRVRAKAENPEPVEVIILWFPADETAPPSETFKSLKPGTEWEHRLSIEEQNQGTLSIALILPKVGADEAARAPQTEAPSPGAGEVEVYPASLVAHKVLKSVPNLKIPPLESDLKQGTD